MRIPAWRLALTGAAITILAVASIGLATGAGAPPSRVANTTLAEETRAPDASAKPDRNGAWERLGKLGGGLSAGRLLRAGRHLVHAEVTVTGKDGELIVLHFDHGTVQAVGGGSLTIAEAGGSTQTVSTDDATKVHLGREKGDLADLTVGDEVFVQSRIDGGSTLAKRILMVPEAAS